MPSTGVHVAGPDAAEAAPEARVAPASDASRAAPAADTAHATPATHSTHSAHSAHSAHSTRATQARLLDAAEALLAERGFAGTSMRALAARAGTSVSAAHYHFGSKLALVAALFESRVAPINAIRLARLEEVIAAAGPGGPSLEAVLDTFARPGFEAWRTGEALGRSPTPHILAQLHVERAPDLDALKRRLLEPVMDRYVEVVRGLLPEHDPARLRVGLGFVLGMLLHVVGGHLEPSLRAAGLASPGDDEALLRHLIAFGAAGLRATAAPGGPAGSEPS